MIDFKLLEKDILNWRRHLHANPELSFQEIQTSKYINDVLSTLPNLVISRPTKTSVVADLQGAKPGKKIALRADIDALAVHEEADIDFKSKNPEVMHACGHDAHTAILLGAAKALSAQKDKLNGSVRFIFQHAEENPPGGAVELVKLGAMKDVDMVFGLHVMPNIEVGKVGIKEGPLTAAADVFTINIQGKGSHGSTPEKSIDPIIVGVEIINNLNHIVSRNVGPFDNVVISIGEFTSGKTANIIPDKARIQGTVRTNQPEVKKLVVKRIKEIIKGVTEMYNATYTLDYIDGYDPTVNNPEATEIVKKAANKVVGSDNVFISTPMMGGEDFSEYTKATKGSFFILGAGTESEGCGYMNHHPKFKINEDCLIIGTKLFTEIVNSILNK